MGPGFALQTAYIVSRLLAFWLACKRVAPFLLKIQPIPIFGLCLIAMFLSGPSLFRLPLQVYSRSISPSVCMAALAPNFRGSSPTSRLSRPSRVAATASIDMILGGPCGPPNGWRFATHLEAQYPRLLCRRVVEHVCAHLPAPKVQALAPAVSLHVDALASLAVQSRRFPPLVSEFRAVVHLPSAAAKPQPSKTLLTGVSSGSLSESGSSSLSFDKVGLYRSPEEFVAAASKVSHPMDTQNPLAKVTSEVLDTIFCQEPKFVRLKRKTNLMKAQLLAKRLAPQERALRDSWSDGMKKVLGSKNLILWETLLSQEGYDDMEVVHLMKRGVPLVGTPDTPPCFEAKLTPATITEAQLRETARWRRKALASKPLAMSDDCFEPLEEACKEELDKGSLEGPFRSEEEVTRFLGHDRWCCIRRFIIQQGDKYRPIDDCCECQLNEGFSSTFKLRLQDADYFACLAMNVCRRVTSNPSRHDLQAWSGKCLDLSRAYKQLAILPAHVDLAVCLTHTKDGKAVYYVPNSLMFGSNAAVYAFNRVSRSIHFILSRLLILPMSCFYDDFPVLIPTHESEEVDGMISDLLDVLGWEHKRTGEGHKGLPFAKQVDILGMRVDLSDISAGQVTLANKPGRIDKICDFVSSIGASGAMTRHQAQVLLGLLNFACGYYHGRALRYLRKDLIDVISGGSLDGRALQVFCNEVKQTMQITPPRVLKLSSSREVVHLYVDGSWENGFAGIGAVLIDPATGEGRVWQGSVPDAIISKWKRLGM